MTQQFLRKASLILVEGERAIDLSEMHFRFQVAAMDVESPSNAQIRVFNLSPETMLKVRSEYSRVVLSAGYEGNFGVIFDGTIRWFRIGRDPSGTETYLDILAADGDIAYNFALVNKSLVAGSTAKQRVDAAIEAMKPKGVTLGHYEPPSSGGILPRGKVLFGMAKAVLREQTQSQGATWSIQNGKVNITPLTGYLPGEAVELNGQTGLIGRPEQTVDGIMAQCLINPKIQAGTRVRINNAAINQMLQRDPKMGPIPWNQWAGVANIANLQADGIYRVFVVEYEGDTRGPAWYSKLTLLSIDPVTDKVKAYG